MCVCVCACVCVCRSSVVCNDIPGFGLGILFFSVWFGVVWIAKGERRSYISRHCESLNGRLLCPAVWHRLLCFRRESGALPGCRLPVIYLCLSVLLSISPFPFHFCVRPLSSNLPPPLSLPLSLSHTHIHTYSPQSCHTWVGFPLEGGRLLLLLYATSTTITTCLISHQNKPCQGGASLLQHTPHRAYFVT